MAVFARLFLFVGFSCVFYGIAWADSPSSNKHLVYQSDFDGDGVSDLVLYDPSTSVLLVRKSSTGEMVESQLGLDVEPVRRFPVPIRKRNSDRATLAYFDRASAGWSEAPGGELAYFGAHRDELGARNLPIPGPYGVFENPSRYSDGPPECSDLAIYNRVDGGVSIKNCEDSYVSNLQWGGDSQKWTVGDFDGDGYSDFTAYNPNGGWWISRVSGSRTNQVMEAPLDYWPFTDQFSPMSSVSVVPWGGRKGDVPMAGDFAGDGKAIPQMFLTGFGGDTGFAVQAVFEILPGVVVPQFWADGVPGDFGFLGEFDGAPGNDYGVWRPTTGEMFVFTTPPTNAFFNVPMVTLESSGVNENLFGGVFGSLFPGGFYDTLLSDFFGGLFGGLGNLDFITDLILGTIPNSGTADDVPQERHPESIPMPLLSSTLMRYNRAIPGDFTRGMRSYVTFKTRIPESVDPARSGLNYIYGRELSGRTMSMYFGFPSDELLFGDTDGDLREEVIVTRVNALRGGGLDWFAWRPGGGAKMVEWGLEGDIPLVGDLDGDGVEDLAVVRPGGFHWFFRRSARPEIHGFQWGLSTDIDIPYLADFDGDGIDEAVIARRENGGFTWFVRQVVPGGGPGVQVIQWGLEGDYPLAPMDWDGDGKADLAIARPEGFSSTSRAPGRMHFFVRYANGSYEIISFHGVQPHAVPFAGRMSGTPHVEAALYMASANGQTPSSFRVMQSGGVETSFQFGTGTDEFYAPNGVSSDALSEFDQSDLLNCHVEKEIRDGRGGSLWKPVSDNTGRPVFLLDGTYAFITDKMQIYTRSGTLVDNMTFRTIANGGRSHWDPHLGGAQLDSRGKLTVVVTLKSGVRECYPIEPNARTRID